MTEAAKSDLEQIGPEHGQFNGEMLRLARGAHGMTQDELAKQLSRALTLSTSTLSNVSQNRVSRWEDGLSCPSKEEVPVIEDVLNFPASFFFQTESPCGFATCCLYHRKRKTLPAATLHTIHDRINVLRIGVSRLLRNVAELPCQFDRMDVDDFAGPEDVARLVRAAWQLPLGPVRNLVAVVEAAGGIVIPCSFDTDKLDAVSQWPHRLPPLFFINRDAPVDRWRWNLAHEVGHIFMHRIPTPNAEEEADRFASEFLMPAREITPELGEMTLEKAARLKPRWRVAMQAIIRKARDTGEITARKYTSLYSYLSAKGYRKNEPVKIAPEEPTTLRRLVETHMSIMKYSVDDLARLTFCRTHEQFHARYSGENKRSQLRVVS